MFSIYYSFPVYDIKVGNIINWKEISLKILKIEGPYFFEVNGQEKYRLLVKKHEAKH